MDFEFIFIFVIFGIFMVSLPFILFIMFSSQDSKYRRSRLTSCYEAKISSSSTIDLDLHKHPPEDSIYKLIKFLEYYNNTKKKNDSYNSVQYTDNYHTNYSDNLCLDDNSYNDVQSIDHSLSNHNNDYYHNLYTNNYSYNDVQNIDDSLDYYNNDYCNDLYTNDNSYNAVEDMLNFPDYDSGPSYDPYENQLYDNCNGGWDN